MPKANSQTYLSVLAILAAFGLGFAAHWFFFARPFERPVTGVVNTSEHGGLSKAGDDQSAATDFAQFWNTWAALDIYFAPPTASTTPPTPDEKVSAAIAGLVQSYHDPYTQFLPRKQADQLKETVRGDFEGIGAVLGELPEQGILVSEVLKGSPAETAGIVRGDIITMVDGRSVVGMDMNAVVAAIRGPSGTEVALKILRGENSSEIKVTRGTVEIPTVASVIVSRLERVRTSIRNGAAALAAGIKDIFNGEPELEKRNYRLVRLVSFSGSSIEQLHTEVEAFAKGDEQAFILDLRDNPGGDLAVATDIASHFLPEGEVVASVRDYKGNEEFYRSKGYHTLDGKNGCIAVVVNGSSASASEILAAALSEHHAAKSVGERTFGKGSVQQLVDVGSLGTLKITVAHWYTPNGESISGQGFTPEFPVREDAEATTGDPYIDTALAVCSEAADPAAETPSE